MRLPTIALCAIIHLMKRVLFLAFTAAFLFIGCVSAPKTEPTKPQTEQTESDKETGTQSESEDESDTEKPEEDSVSTAKYDDWKYKGFGTELPEWFEPALEYDDSTVKSLLELTPETLIRIVFAQGVDVDQCEQILNEVSEELVSEFELLQSFWARLNPFLYEQEDLYNSVRIYVSNDDVLEINDN